MATNYQVNISMSVDSANALRNGNYYMYGFKAVAASQGGGAPLVWFQSQTYSTSTNVEWETQYQAYTSSSAIIPNGQITASFSDDIDLNQTLQVTSDTGTGTVVASGTQSAISILNQTSSPFTCGISEVYEGQANAMCAFPLYGNGMDVIAPIEKVLLTFATKQVNTGTVIEKAYSQGFLIDLTGAPSNTRDVFFDINQGWSCGGCTWAEQVPPNANLSPLLIESSAAAMRKYGLQLIG